MTARHFLLGLTLVLLLLVSILGVSTSALAATVCTPTNTISGPYAQDGAGDLCFQTSDLCAYINSWNLSTLEVNGMDYTNLYVASNTIAPLNGVYIIHYVSTVAWGHFEISGTCSGGSPTSTPISATNTPVSATNTPTRTNTSPAATNTPTRTNTPAAATNTPTRTNTPAAATNTPVPPTNTSPAPTATPGGSGTCSPVNATISAPFSHDGSGTFCWQSNNLGGYANSWNLASLTINGVDFTNTYVSSGSYPAQIGGYWYVHYIGNVSWGHFEASGTGGPTNTPAAATNTPTRTLTPSGPTNTPTRTLTPSITPTAGPTSSSAVLYVGRFNTSDPAGPKSAWSATTIKANFSGTGISANLVSTGDNWYNVIVDGVTLAPVHLPAGTNGSITLASGLSSGNHTLAFVRRTEAWVGDVQFKGFTATGGQLLAPPAASSRRIEFVGDSITCGYGNEGPNQYQSFTTQNENAYLAYGPVTARALNADEFNICWSGKGVIRNYGGDTTDLMPSLYARILPYDTTTLWNPSGWIPQVVVINLGTNDFASGIPDQTAFTSGYANFVNQIRSQYPNAHIYIALGPMLSGDSLTSARSYLTTVVNQFHSAGDANVHFIEFPTQDGSLGYGEDWHPSVAEHGVMADQLINQIKADLGW